jgi:hypothetical protein
VLEPLTDNKAIAIAGFNNNTDALDLTATELDQLQEGFSSITIGKTTGSGNITIDSRTFTDPVTIQAPGWLNYGGWRNSGTRQCLNNAQRFNHPERQPHY